MIFFFLLKKIDFVYTLERGGSNEYPQSMFSSKNKKKKNVYPCKSQFYYIKVGCKGVYITRTSRTCYHDAVMIFTMSELVNSKGLND